MVDVLDVSPRSRGRRAVPLVATAAATGVLLAGVWWVAGEREVVAPAAGVATATATVTATGTSTPAATGLAADVERVVLAALPPGVRQDEVVPFGPREAVAPIPGRQEFSGVLVDDLGRTDVTVFVQAPGEGTDEPLLCQDDFSRDCLDVTGPGGVTGRAAVTFFPDAGPYESTRAMLVRPDGVVVQVEVGTYGRQYFASRVRGLVFGTEEERPDPLLGSRATADLALAVMALPTVGP